MSSLKEFEPENRASEPVSKDWAVVLVYSLTIFLSAVLLFVVQPMFARLILPLLGGSPYVWNTVLVFYQAALLAGYSYSHFSIKWLGFKKQIIVHLILLALAFSVLPFGVGSASPPKDANPVPWLLVLCLTSVGLPFFAVSATSPILQRWFSISEHKSASDPYFLYAASNVGSFLGLIAYPWILEPNLTLAQQTSAWKWGFLVLAALMVACSIFAWRAKHVTKEPPSELTENEAEGRLAAPTGRRKAKWVLLAFIPSSLMVAVTTYLTTDVASIPMLWAVPLGLYLLTFTVAFGKYPKALHQIFVWALPFFLVLLVCCQAGQIHKPIMIVIGIITVAYLLTCMVMHGELAHDRPASTYLTEFFLWTSLGGVLGGMFCGLIAPMVFKGVEEYLLTLILAGCCVPLLKGSFRKNQWLELFIPVAVGTVAYLSLEITNDMTFASKSIAYLAQYGGPGALCLIGIYGLRKPIGFGLALGAILGVYMYNEIKDPYLLYSDRSFFGVLRVRASRAGQWHTLDHGTTLHGKQWFNAPEEGNRRLPVTYYYPNGPIGQVFADVKLPANARIAAVGLGVGTLSAYAEPDQEWTFFEIDPMVVKIAQNTDLFTYLLRCPAKQSFVLGDARLSLLKDKTKYDLIVLDAYSSDSIPVHLLTVEALRLYKARLNPKGLIAFHVSNRNLNLQPVIGNLAASEEMEAIAQANRASDEDEKKGKTASEWVVLARSKADFQHLLDAGRAPNETWLPAIIDAEYGVWTDDYSSVLKVFIWENFTKIR